MNRRPAGEPNSKQQNSREVVASETVGAHTGILMMPNEE
jgi:hypothetical protein